MAFESNYVWHQGKVVPFAEANVHILTSSLHYGTAVFEGIRAYLTPKGSAVFRLKDHIDRLLKSAAILGMVNFPHTADELYEATFEVVRKNGFDECYIRPIIYISEGGWSLTVDSIRVEASIAVWKWTNYLGEQALKSGIRANVSSFARHHINVSLTKGKIAGNYVNSVLAKTESVRLGFEEAILLDPDGFVAECTGENIFLVRDGVIYTPPKSTILEGLTRNTIMTLAKDLGHEIVEEKISRDQLYISDEVFVTGTAAEVVALREVDFRKIGTGSTGPVCMELQQAYSDVIHGKNQKYNHWLDYC